MSALTIDEREQARELLDRRLAGPLLDAMGNPDEPVGRDERCTCAACGTQVGPFVRADKGKQEVFCRVCRFFSRAYGDNGRGRLVQGAFLVCDVSEGTAIEISEKYHALRAAATQCGISPQTPSIATAMRTDVPFVFGFLQKSYKYLCGHWHLGGATWMAVSGKVSIFGQIILEGRYLKQSILAKTKQFDGVPANLIKTARSLLIFSAFSDNPGAPRVSDKVLAHPETARKPHELPSGLHAVELLCNLGDRFPGLRVLAEEPDDAPITRLAHAFAREKQSLAASAAQADASSVGAPQLEEDRCNANR
mgnify:CR=1 FL=1